MSAFPDSIRVKLSSEAAGAISLSPVIVRDIPAREFIDYMLPQTGKRIDRIQEILLRGTMVSGASRFRWDGLHATGSGIAAILAHFPDPDPARPFAPRQCVHATLCGPSSRIELPREAASKRGFFRRTSYWDILIRLAPHYHDYSYKHHADLYRSALTTQTASTLRAESSRLVYSTLTRQIQTAIFDTVEFQVPRL